MEHQVGAADFNQYGTRRGNHEVMMRGTFANIRIKNQMLGSNGRREGGYTIHYPSGERCRSTTPPCATRRGVPLVIFAGNEYGNGSSRDWAAKGTNLLGVRAVIAQSLRAHPPLEPGRHGRRAVRLRGGDVMAVARPQGRRDGHDRRARRDLKPRQKMEAGITYADGTVKTVPVICRIDTLDELEYFRNGGILQYVLRHLAA